MAAIWAFPRKEAEGQSAVSMCIHKLRISEYLGGIGGAYESPYFRRSYSAVDNFPLVWMLDGVELVSELVELVATQLNWLSEVIFSHLSTMQSIFSFAFCLV